MSSWLPSEDEDDGWDLQAVVRSCRPANSPAAEAAAPPPPSWKPLIFHSTESLLPSHPADLIDTSNVFYELEELCKPSLSTTRQPKSHLSAPASSPAPAKRRKNRQKRMVRQVLADGFSGDLWAWRKYGQKPIKGSPFPRGYYRCSSSKGCLARKQVERSRTDSGMFVITYSGEHNHPLPTHRNSLAGSTRQKFPAAGEGGVRLSPNTPLTAEMEEELLQGRKKKKKEEEEKGSSDEEEEEVLDVLLVEDMEVLGEDEILFMGIEEMQSSSSKAGDGGLS